MLYLAFSESCATCNYTLTRQHCFLAGFGFGGVWWGYFGCVYVIFAYWRCKLMASLTIVTVVLNGILLGITRIPFHRFVLSVPHSPIQGPLVMGLVSMME